MALHNIIKQLDDGLFSKKVLELIKTSARLELLVKNSRVYNLSAPHKRGITRFRRIMPGPT